MSRSNEPRPIHPGIYLRQSVIPAGLSVTETAERLGIGRPALSSFLNGRASLSSDLALRFEKALGVDSDYLLEMQARYDRFMASARRDEIAVRALVPAYGRITTHEIADWADKIEARAQFAALLRMLVNSTGEKLKKVNFPAHHNSQRRGWDGQVDSGAETPWIPSGKSGWEFSCSKNPRAKANLDYKSRTAKIAAADRRAITFVFVTSRIWEEKDQWANNKKSKSLWKNVRALDAIDLEQWLEQSIPAQTYFKEFQGADHAVCTLDQIWCEWACVTKPNLNRNLFEPAVSRLKDQLEAWFANQPQEPFVVTADSHLEGLAFLACALMRLRNPVDEIYYRSVVIRSLEAFNRIPKGLLTYVPIIASSEVERALAGLQERVHTIIVRARGTFIVETDITLGPLGHQDFRTTLKEMGLDKRQIHQLELESGRSPTILRRRLAVIPAIKCPPWSDDPKIVDKLVPLIFVGAWDSKVLADQEILKCLTGQDFDEVERTVTSLQQEPDPTVWSIGTFRGVVSKVEALDAVANSITLDNFENFLVVAEIVLSEDDPSLDLPEEMRWAANLYGKSRDHSPTLRRAICDTLVLMAVRGNGLIQATIGKDIEAEIGGIIQRCLTPSSKSKWLSQKDDLPHFAEAAPEMFLRIVEKDVRSPTPQIASLFTPVKSSILGSCPRAGLLWSLELLAWKPSRLLRVAVILAELCRWKIADNWGNTPLRSLKSLFRSWLPQTAAKLEERMRALASLSRQYPDVTWQICVDQFNSESSIGDLNHRPAWRTDGDEVGEVATIPERQHAQRHAIDLALDWPSYDAEKLGDLVESLERFLPEDRLRVWDLIFFWIDSEPSNEEQAILREQIGRRVLSSYFLRRNSDTSSIKHARKAFTLLEASDPVARSRPFFRHVWPDVSGYEDDDEELDSAKLIERIASRRRAILLELWEEVGLQGILDLCRSSEEPRLIGFHLAELQSIIEPVTSFVQNLLLVESVDSHEKFDRCIEGILTKLESKRRSRVLSELLERMQGQDETCIRLLLCAPFDTDTWDLVDNLKIDNRNQYWNNVHPSRWRHETPGIAKLVGELLAVNRASVAFSVAHTDWKLVDSGQLIRLLTELATSKVEPSGYYQIEPFYISSALDVLEERVDVPREEIANLEFMYLQVLVHTDHGIRNLERQLSESPTLFVQILASAFKRRDSGEDPAELDLAVGENGVASAQAAHLLLMEASRIPGTQADGSISLEHLQEWIKHVREFARQVGRADIGDQMIGQLLSHCSVGDDGAWPCEPVRDAIEGIASDQIAIGMSVGIQNARGVIVRGEGGEEERKLAERYWSWSRQVAFDHSYVSAILEDIARSYDKEAEWHDQDSSLRQRLGH